MSKSDVDPKVAVVSGAGSGVGRAIVQRLLNDGWHVALVGRRADALTQSVAHTSSDARDRALVCPCDVGNADEVEAMAKTVLARFPEGVHVLVNAAGTNVPRRSLDVLSV